MDRAEELRQMENIWPEIERHMGDALADTARACMVFLSRCVDEFATGDGETLRAMCAKYAAGEREHRRDWLQMERAQMEGEIENELLDQVLYAAMIRARWGE